MAPKVVTALEPDPSQITWLQRMAGGACLIVFVSTWLLSLVSPFVLVWSLVQQNYIVTVVIVVVTAAAYLPWKPGFLAQSVRHVIKTYTPCYFQSIVMAFEGDRDSDNNTTTPLPCAKTDPQTFYAIHPHGAFCVGWAMLYCHDVMQHVKFCFAPALYASPFFRLFARLTGRPGSAAKASMVAYMKRGESIALPPGGFEEATLTSTTVDRVFIQKRTGFIRLCLQYGIRVQPVYVFGEKGFFGNVQGMFPTRLALNRFGIPALLPWGSMCLPLLPRGNVDMRIVVGPPLVLPQIDHPTKQDVKHWHDKYVVALVKLFDNHKQVAYGPDTGKVAKLEVW